MKEILHRISIPKSHQMRRIEEIGIHLLHSKKSKTVREIIDKFSQEVKNE